MIKKTIESSESVKISYEKAIKDIQEKYEKQIQDMKIIIVKQNEKFEEKLKNLNLSVFESI